MRFAVVIACIFAGTAVVYSDSSTSGASRTTEISQRTVASEEPASISVGTIDEWVRRWQRRLGLAEWKIETKIVRLSDLPRGTIANIHWSLPRRTATIRVMDSADSSLPLAEFIRDTELSVVHELIHLSMAKLPLDGNDTELEEEAVKRISTALLALEKGDSDSQ